MKVFRYGLQVGDCAFKFDAEVRPRDLSGPCVEPAGPVLADLGPFAAVHTFKLANVAAAMTRRTFGGSAWGRRTGRRCMRFWRSRHER